MKAIHNNTGIAQRVELAVINEDKEQFESDSQLLSGVPFRINAVINEDKEQFESDSQLLTDHKAMNLSCDQRR